MDNDNQQILEQMREINKLLSNIFIFLLVKERYTDAQIRKIFGRVDNNRIRLISKGLKNKKGNK